jgi:hypothetical protein
MAETTYTITHNDVGSVLAPPNGWITALSMIAPPSRYDSSALSADRTAWLSGAAVR